MNKRTELNISLISKSQITKMQNKDMGIMWALWLVEKCLNIMEHCILVSTFLFRLKLWFMIN